ARRRPRNGPRNRRRSEKKSGRARSPLPGRDWRPLASIGVLLLLLLADLLEVGLDDSAILGGQTTRQFHQRPGAILFGELAPDLGGFLVALLLGLSVPPGGV